MPTTTGIVRALAGGVEEAFQANTANLSVFGDAMRGDTGQGMAWSMSPAIAASPRGGFRVAFQANTGSLFTFDSTSGPANLGQGMASGTSPAIAALAGGSYEVAFQANTGNLFVFGDAGRRRHSPGRGLGHQPCDRSQPVRRQRLRL